MATDRGACVSLKGFVLLPVLILFGMVSVVLQSMNADDNTVQAASLLVTRNVIYIREIDGFVADFVETDELSMTETMAQAGEINIEITDLDSCLNLNAYAVGGFGPAVNQAMDQVFGQSLREINWPLLGFPKNIDLASEAARMSEWGLKLCTLPSSINAIGYDTLTSQALLAFFGEQLGPGFSPSTDPSDKPSWDILTPSMQRLFKDNGIESSSRGRLEALVVRVHDHSHHSHILLTDLTQPQQRYRIFFEPVYSETRLRTAMSINEDERS